MPSSHDSLHPDEPTEHARSAAPPSPLPPSLTPARQDTIPGLEAVERWPWAAPSDNDFGPTATAWRAAKAFSRTDRHRGELDGLGKSLDKLRETIDAGIAFLSGLARLAKWAGGILGAAALLAGGGALLRWLLTHIH